MKLPSKKLSYKSLFGYSLMVIALLIVAVPVFAANSSRTRLLDLSFGDRTGQTPQSSRTLSQGINVDHLNPGQENWYMYDRDSFDSTLSSWVSLALRYESEARITSDQVNFEVFAQMPSNSWFQSESSSPQMLGVGARSPLKTANQALVESFWSGRLEEQGFYVRVFNNSPFGLDYTLEAKDEQPAVAGAVPAGLNTARSEAEALNARQLAWTLTAQAVENMTAGEAAFWMRQAQSVGWLVTQGMAAESIPQPGEADPQKLWDLTAQAISGQDADAAAQWLIQADALGWLSISLNGSQRLYAAGKVGQNEVSPSGSFVPTQPSEPQEKYTPINIYPNNPLELNPEHVNSGRLLPYGEHWYTLRRDDLDKDLIEDMEMTMFFTPRTGYMSDRINFEIFPAGQYHIWARGDSNYMEHFGLGMWVSRDEDPDTGERLWTGSLVDGDRYLIKVKNGTPDVVDYYLFPNDVENSELGNPTLHQSDKATGYVPYALSPPTRPEFSR